MSGVTATRPVASVSLDLDNLWSYMKTHGDEGWRSLPSFLDVVVPRMLALFAAHRLAATVFVVGTDAARPENRGALEAIVASGHEIGNHSHRHEPWLHRYAPAEIASEIATAEDAIAAATGVRPTGFRGPGYSVSPALLDVLAGRGYRYDASLLSTFVGPLARAWYLRSFQGGAEERRARAELFGRFRDGFLPNRPFLWRLASGPLAEIPVTTVPGVRVPLHATYLFFLAERSPALARGYFRIALAACRAAGVAPSFLLHPTDLLDAGDRAALPYFPGMGLSAGDKRSLLDFCLAGLADRYALGTVGRHAVAASADPAIRTRTPEALSGAT